MTSFSDDFNRADSTDLGANWVEVSGDWSIVSNQLSPGTTAVTVVLRAATAMATNNHSAQITIAATTPVSQGVWCRGDATLTSGYVWRNSGTSWDLFSVVGSTFTNIGTFAGAAAPGDVAKVQAVGSTITGFVNGVSRVSVTNTAVTTGLSVGLRSMATSGLRYDNFAAADITTTVNGTATASFGGLTGAATGTRTVVGTAALAEGPLTGAATGIHTVIGTAAAPLGGLTASMTSPSHVTGTANATLGALTATAHVPVPAAPDQGSWYGLLDILREGAQLYRDEMDRDPVACLDCGEPLRTGPRGELYCPFDGSTWTAGNRRTGRVTARY
jgi:hypothetical protein